jgi:hypothetical protein
LIACHPSVDTDVNVNGFTTVYVRERVVENDAWRHLSQAGLFDQADKASTGWVFAQ